MNVPMEKTILVVAGGSGGHIFPAVGFSQAFRQRFPGIGVVFVTDSAAASCSIPSGLFSVFLRVERTPAGMLKFFWDSIRIMARVRPYAVFGFGGYLAVPFVILAKCFGRQALLHEQNVVPGKANRFLSYAADKIAVSFVQTLKWFGRKAFLCRYPLRSALVLRSRREAVDFFGLDGDRFTVLIMGGSQGAQRVNDVFLKSLAINGNLARFQVIHLSGRADFAKVEGAYRHIKIRSKVFAFLVEMDYAYSAADLVVSRAGAGSVFEIMRYGLPSVLIPYPYAGGHQTENAKVLAKAGAAILLEEEGLSPQTLSGLLDIFLDDPVRRRVMAVHASALYGASQGLGLEDVVL